MRCFQVQYEQNGKKWLADVNVMPWDEPKMNIGAICLFDLMRRFGPVNNVKIIQEYGRSNNPCKDAEKAHAGEARAKKVQR